MLELLTELFNEGKFNRVQTVATAARTVLRIAYDTDPASHASKKLVIAARQQQLLAMTKSGDGVVTQTIEMRRYWTHVCKRIRTAESSGKAWYVVIEVAEHRQWVMVWLRCQTACRPQDLFGLLDGIERFDGTSWLDSNVVHLRFWNGKDTHSDNMNVHDRPAADEQQGKLTSAVVVCRPKPPIGHELPNGFEMIHRYKERVGERLAAPRHSVTLSHGGKVERLKLRRFFLGVGPVYSDTELKRSTISSLTRKSLVEAGAMSEASPLKAEHLRHSALSAVYFAIPDRLPDALLRSRHSRDVFLRNYDLTTAPSQRIVLERLDSDDLDVVMLG